MFSVWVSRVRCVQSPFVVVSVPVEASVVVPAPEIVELLPQSKVAVDRQGAGVGERRVSELEPAGGADRRAAGGVDLAAADPRRARAAERGAAERVGAAGELDHRAARRAELTGRGRPAAAAAEAHRARGRA